MVQTDWLAQTKFLPPRLCEDFVTRERLCNALYDLARTHVLTLISAPPGYGKTTLLASLPAAFPGFSLAWVAVEDEDNDPARFLRALVGSLQRLKPGFGVNIQMLLASLPDPVGETRRVISALINDAMDNLPETWVVFDDLHIIKEPAVFTALDYFLERMPPQMHLIIATRYDPPLALARMRARGQLAELRVPDLRFTTDEASLFFNEKQGLDLSSTNLATLQSRAEGWAAGLRLLAGSLDRIHTAGDRDAFIQDLTRTDRYVFDFLADEVLKRQEPDIRTFLLETSILAEMTPALCEAITGRSDAQSILESLYRRNLFLVQVGETGKAFRYHAMFAEFLREQLARETPGRIAELHRRAAEAQKVNAPARAITHYLSAGLWEETAQLVEQISDGFVRMGMLRTLRVWIEPLPEPIRAEHPRLRYLQGLCSVQLGRLGEGMEMLESAWRGFEARHDPIGQGETLLAMVDTASLQQDYSRQAELVQQALAFPLPVHGQVELLMAQAWQSVYLGDSKQTVDALDKALHLSLTANDMRSFNVIAPILNLQMAFLPNGVERLENYCHQLLLRLGDQVGLVQACTHSTLSYTRFLSGLIDDAAHEAQQALYITRQIGNYPFSEAQMHFVQGMCKAVRGDYAGMVQDWTTLLPWVEQTPAMQRYLVAIYFLVGRGQWMQGNLDQARQIEAKMRTIVYSNELPEVTMSRNLMHALVNISDSNFDSAERVLQQTLPIEQRWAHAKFYGSAVILLAYIYLKQKREKEALTLFIPFLDDCERKKTLGLVLQETKIAIPLLHLVIERKAHVKFAARLLEILDVANLPEPITIPETGQSLTRREVEVLKLIVDGASNQTIAQRLVISEHTVKVHITNILAKLDVSTRMQAAVRARDLHIV